MTAGICTHVEPAGSIENVQRAAWEQVAYLVDLADAGALDLLGEIRQAFELVDRHVGASNTMGE